MCNIEKKYIYMYQYFFIAYYFSSDFIATDNW